VAKTNHGRSLVDPACEAIDEPIGQTGGLPLVGAQSAVNSRLDLSRLKHHRGRLFRVLRFHIEHTDFFWVQSSA